MAEPQVFIQYDMFTDDEPFDKKDAIELRMRMAQCENMANNVRKGVYARLSERDKILLMMIEEVEFLKKRVYELERR